MEAQDVILITGANGEIGHGLIAHLCDQGVGTIIATDIQPLDSSLASSCHEFVQGDITDGKLFKTLELRGPFTVIFHLASILSTKAEREPDLAYEVNVGGTLRLLQFAHADSQRLDRPVRLVSSKFESPPTGCPDARRPRPTRGTGPRGRVAHADHDVRMQQAGVRASGSILRVSLQAARRRTPGRTSRFSLATLPRADQRGDGALGRNQRLCAGDDPTPPRELPTIASSAQTRAFPSWSCRMPSRPCFCSRRRQKPPSPERRTT